MTAYKKQHYVPQFYLRNFSKNNNNINCLDKEEKRTYSAPIRNIAQGKKFYETANINIEHDLSSIERQASRDIRILLKNKKYKLLNDQKYKFRLAFYIYIQLIRTKQVREDINNLITKIKENDDENLSSDSEINDYFDDLIDELEIKETHLEFITDFDIDIIRLIFTKKWIFMENHTRLNFWTSDNPVVMCNKKGNLGLEIAHIHIFFPLSPKYCLCLIDPFNYSNFNNPMNIDFTLPNEKNNIDSHLNTANYMKIIKKNMKTPNNYKITDEKIIREINSLQIKYCYRAVYSIDSEFRDENNEFKSWINEYLEKFKNESITHVSEFKTKDGGKLIIQKKL